MWRTGALYFAIVFAVAFGLGAVRTFWLEPALGKDFAVALESPFLVLAMFFAARRAIADQFLGPWGLLGAGAIALALQQFAELALVFARGQTVRDYGASFATLHGQIFAVTLGLFALMPWLVGRRR